MGNKLILITALLTSIFSSCGDEKDITTDPAAHNDTIVSIFLPVQSAYNELMEGIYSKRGSDLSQLHHHYKEEAKITAEKIGDLPPFQTDSTLLSPSRALAEFYYRSSTNEFEHIIQTLNAEEGSGIKTPAIEQELLVLLSKEKEMYQDFMKKQRDFAERNQLELVYPDTID